jgi:hypothetical protein
MVVILKAVEPKFMECLQKMLMHKTMFENASDYYTIIELAKRNESKFT